MLRSLVGSEMCIRDRYTSEFVAELLGTFLSTQVLAGAPFNNPLMVQTAPANNKPVTSKSMVKFKAQFWQLVIHSSMSVLEYVVLAQVTDIAGVSLFEDPDVMSLYKQDEPPLLTWLYLIQLAIWLVTAGFHIWVFQPQSDYFVMLIHHIVTIALIVISLQNNFLRFGLAVLWIHDLSDIPIDMLKLTNYLQLEDKAGFFLVELSYTSCMVVWAYYRLFLYPTAVIWNGVITSCCAATAAGLNAIPSPELFCSYVDPSSFATLVPHWEHLATTVNAEVVPFGVTRFWAWSTAWLLSTLYLMHIWWYFLLLGILYKIIVTGSPHEAGRQQYEGEDGLIEDKQDPKQD
eukprot:TRINITY_DN60454_c0_g1_i2.p1 TRINITY_DN60454_c0_g1~~TRINITY_DN60454_c0_g1_i2.p1  ORF type:complete len:389 (+),score=95.63 TRINITY_DN60454_c0_g1_i2:131-1168(+)